MDDLLGENDKNINFLESESNPIGAGDFPIQARQQEGAGGTDEASRPVSERLTTEEFERLRMRREQLPFGLAFPLTRSDYKPGSSAVSFTIDNGAVTISARFPSSITDRLPAKHDPNLQISQDGTQITYRTDDPGSETTKRPTSSEPPPDECIDGHERRIFPPQERRVKTISSEELAQLISSTPGDGIIFYTGAGISRGGNKPVWDMSTLISKLHMQGIYNSDDPNGAITTFLPVLTDNPSILAETFKVFQQQLYEDVSTPAHEAIANLVTAKPGAIVLTENLDLKHEADGSRISAVHIPGPDSFAIISQHANTAQLLITVGLSVDHHAIIAYLKDKNPDLKIITLSLPPALNKTSRIFRVLPMATWRSMATARLYSHRLQIL